VCSSDLVRSGRDSFVAEYPLPFKDIRKDQRSNDCGVGLDNEFRCVDAKFSPGDFLVWHRSGIRTVAGSRVTYLAEVTPERNTIPLEILVKHRHHTNGEIAGNSTTDLEESDSLVTGVLRIPVCQPHHILDT